MKRCKIIAEAGVNHNGSLETAKQLVDVAAKAGADIVKFQSFKADSLVTAKAKMADYQVANTGNSQSQYQMLKELELSDSDHAELFAYCKTKKIEFLSTAFDLADLDFLIAKNYIREIKIPSGEITNAPYLFHASRKGLPMMLSTGMCSLAEVETAMGVLAFGLLHPQKDPKGTDFRKFWQSPVARAKLAEKVTLLQCTTEYPAPFAEVNLRVIQTYREHFGIEVGFSDHTPGIEAAVASVALGASVVEKHFTLSREMKGPDHKASLEPDQLEQMIRSIRHVEMALGNGIKATTAAETKNIAVARKSLVALRPIRVGEAFCPENLGVKRPGSGKSPMLYWDYLGKKADKDYEPDDLI